jgi:hypothetical protein
MSDLSCQSKYCFHYDSTRFFCNCRLADRKLSASFIQECRANRRLQEDLNLSKGNEYVEKKHERTN